jgi:Chlamydia polymorphic membrane protein (Chlamydia_PMP) repeat
MSSSRFSILLGRRFGVRYRPQSRRRSLRCAPQLGALEVRALLSTLTVTNDNDSGTGSLRAALTSAANGDMIEFARSAYGTITLSSGPLEVTANVNIDGPGANKVTVSGNDTFQDLLIDANVTATISKLTITDGTTPFNAFFGGGGIYNQGTLTVANCVITGNSSTSAGGGISSGGDLTVTSSVLSDNTASDGGAISNNPGGTLKVSGSTISNNSAGNGGGIDSLGVATITGSIVTNNSANYGGGIASGAEFGSAAITITGSVVSNNTAQSAGGGLYSNSVGPTISGCTFANNVAGNTNGFSANGGAVAVLGGVTLNVSSSSFTDNSAISTTLFGFFNGGSDGGAIYIENNNFFGPTATLNVTTSSFTGNTAVGWETEGGAVHVDFGVVTNVSLSSFTDNTTTAPNSAQGGALYLINSNNQATLTNVTFQGNQALGSTGLIPGAGDGSGGAIWAGCPLSVVGSAFTANEGVGDPGGQGNGGAIFFDGPTLDLSYTLFFDNSALGGTSDGLGVGGAVDMLTGDGVFSNTDFIANQAVGGAATGAGSLGGDAIGGAISAGNSLTLTNSTLSGNESIAGAGSDGAGGGTAEGGAIAADFGVDAISDCTIIANAAIGGAGGGSGFGGGIFTDATLTVTDTLITLNVADGGSGGQGIGGGLYIGAGTTTLTGKTNVVFNFASTSNDNIFGSYST